MASHRPPAARNLGAAIDASPSLSTLLAGHRRSAACFEPVQRRLPPALRDGVRPGPIDGGRWTLFVQNGAVAAKLRQLVPDLLAAASEREPTLTELRIRILPRTP